MCPDRNGSPVQSQGTITNLYAMKYCPACHRTYPPDYNVCPSDQTSLQSARELQPGMVIRNKYEILEQIGVGGMGFVYRGRHITFNELCAIKIVNDVIAADANFLQRFQTEAVVTRKLRHPNAVRVDDYDYTEDGRPFIVMELVEGKNVGETLQEQGPLPVPRALRITTQVAQALGFAHNLGIVHRDIKPGNIILTTNQQGQETAKVLDFGIAKLREAAGFSKPGMTMTGMVVGTPLYMSPEQFMGKKAGEEIDGRTDLYSLGVVLYQMVTARLPFEGDTLYSLMMQHIEGNVRPPHELAPELQIPASLSRVILKSIDKAREQRFQTADEFIAALDQVETESVGSPMPTPAVPNLAPPSGVQRSTVGTPSPSPAYVPTVREPAPQPAVRQPSQVAPVPAQPSPATAASPPMPAVPPVVAKPFGTQPITVPTAPVVPNASPAPASKPDSLLVKSAEQHVLLQPRKFRARNLVLILVLLTAAALVAGVGYLKYRAIRRIQVENAVNEKLGTAASATLRQAGIQVSVSDARQVTLDGMVPSPDDATAAESLASSVPGVTGVSNRIQVVQKHVNGGQTGAQTDSPESLIQKGKASLDAGDYSSAIDSFTKAAADPKVAVQAQQLLQQAVRAQATEENLLKNRR